MKICFDIRTKSRAIKRVLTAMRRYLPDQIEEVKKWKGADLVFIHVFGRQGRITRNIERLKARGIKYAILQYSLRSTRNPSTKGWLPLWRDAELVWSYLSLNGYLRQDGLEPLTNFYPSPLGIDSEVFHPLDRERDYLCVTTGESYLAQSVREIVLAARGIGKVAHIGADLNKSEVDIYTDISDHKLVSIYSRSLYASSLRRVEGFEWPGAEGLLCGAMPLVYDRHDHRKWYRDLAIFIPETKRDQIVEDVRKVFESEYAPPTKAMIAEAKDRFNWETIFAGLWERL